MKIVLKRLDHYDRDVAMKYSTNAHTRPKGVCAFIMEYGIVGYGHVGKALARALGCAAIVQGHQDIDQAWEKLRPCTVIFLSVSDSAIHTVAQQLAGQGDWSGKTFLHCSGALTSEVLQPLADAGAAIGSLHPLQSFATGEESLANIYISLEGAPQVVELGRTIVAQLQGKSIQIPAEQRALYHAAACLASNSLVTVVAAAQDVLSRLTGDKQSALEALLPLIDGTVQNLHKAKQAGEVLTGPISRGDAVTVAAHVAILPANILPFYENVSQATVTLALNNKKITAVQAAALEEILA